MRHSGHCWGNDWALKVVIRGCFPGLGLAPSRALFEEMFDIQTQYARKSHDTYVSEMSKLGEKYRDTTRNASKALEQTARSRS